MGNIEAIDAHLGGNGQIIVEEARFAGLELALACALVEQESGGENIFGCDAGDVGDYPPYCHQPVTYERVQILRDGGEYTYGMNGVGLTQLTWWSLVEEAEAMGGAHIPANQCRVGFRLLKRYIDDYSYLEALGAYNAGEGNRRLGIDNGYAQSLANKHEAWKMVLGGAGEEEGTSVVTGQDIVDSARKLLGVWYEWWSEGEPIPLWWYEYGDSPPPREWFDANGTMCSDLVNFARVDNGLPSIGGTPAFYDWLMDSGLAQDFDPDAPGVPGAVVVNPGVWRGGTGQGHISIFVDEHTILQATDGIGSFAGVNEGEKDYTSHGWASYWIYALMPDVDYSGDLGDDAPDPTDNPIPKPRWVSIDKAGWLRADGPDWAKGWHSYYDNGTIGPYHGPGEA